MPWNDPAVRKEYNKVYWKKWYAANKDKHKKDVIEYRKANQEYFKKWRLKNKKK